MQESALLDAVGFTRNLEAAYRRIWTVWCAGPREELSTDTPQGQSNKLACSPSSKR
jgi:hypothetical protein